jgi:hypothetical protein
MILITKWNVRFSWDYDAADLFEMWVQYEENGVMAVAGGYLDQPPEWREMIHTLRRTYGVLRFQVEQQVKARPK